MSYFKRILCHLFGCNLLVIFDEIMYGVVDAHSTCSRCASKSMLTLRLTDMTQGWFYRRADTALYLEFLYKMGKIK